MSCFFFFFFSSRRRHTRWPRDWSSDVCSSDLPPINIAAPPECIAAAASSLRPPISHGGARMYASRWKDKRSEERRVGKEWRSRGTPEHQKKKEGEEQQGRGERQGRGHK